MQNNMEQINSHYCQKMQVQQQAKSVDYAEENWSLYNVRNYLKYSIIQNKNIKQISKKQPCSCNVLF